MFSRNRAFLWKVSFVILSVCYILARHLYLWPWLHFKFQVVGFLRSSRMIVSGYVYPCVCLFSHLCPAFPMQYLGCCDAGMRVDIDNMALQLQADYRSDTCSGHCCMPGPLLCAWACAACLGLWCVFNWHVHLSLLLRSVSMPEEKRAAFRNVVAKGKYHNNLVPRL